MNQLWIIYVIVFCAVLLGVQGAYWFFSEQQRTRGAINRRLILAKQNASARDVFEILKRERGLIGLDSERFEYWKDAGRHRVFTGRPVLCALRHCLRL
jgi:hypothetical protein